VSLSPLDIASTATEVDIYEGGSYRQDFSLERKK